MKLYKCFNAENICCLQNNKESMKIWDHCYWYLLFSFCNAAFNFSAVNWKGWLSSSVIYRKKISARIKRLNFQEGTNVTQLTWQIHLAVLEGKHLQTKFTRSMTDLELTNVSAEQCLHRTSAILHIWWHPLLPLCSLRKWWAVSKSTTQAPSPPLASVCNFRFFSLLPVNVC